MSPLAGILADLGGGVLAERVVLVDASGNPIVYDQTNRTPVSNYAQGGTAGVPGDTSEKLFSWTADGQAAAGNAKLVKAILFSNTGAALNNLGDGEAGGLARVPLLGFGLFDGSANAQRARTPAWFANLAATAVTAGTPVVFRTPGAGLKARLMGFMLSLSVAGSVIFKYGAGNTEFLRTPLMGAGVGLASELLGNGLVPGAANDAFKIDVTATGSVSGFVFGMDE